MSDSPTLFPNTWQSTATLKACAPMGVKFWENQEAALNDLKEFADGWFARRQKAMRAALEAAQHLGDADGPSDMLREYQSWLTREMEVLAEDGKAYQQHILKAEARLRLQQQDQQQALQAIAHPSTRPEERAAERRSA